MLRPCCTAAAVGSCRASTVVAVSASPPTPGGSTSASGWPGRRLGLPPEGPGSIARLGRRLVALAIDWAASTALSFGFLGGDPWVTLAIFVAVQVVFVALAGSSPGHRLLGLRVVRADGAAPGLVDALVRGVLIALVIPPVVVDVDQRGLHDRARGTVLLRR